MVDRFRVLGPKQGEFMQMLTRMCRASLALVGVFALCLAVLLWATPAVAVEVQAEAEKANAEGHGGGDHGGHDQGVPLKWDNATRDLVIWSIVTFVVFLVVLKAAAWGPLIEGLNNREAKYEKLLRDAETDRSTALKMLADYEQKLKTAEARVDEIIAEARRDADHTKAEIVATAQREADLTRQRALDDINRAKDQAVAALFSHMRSNVISATERVLSRSLTDADHLRLVDEALAEVASRN